MDLHVEYSSLKTLLNSNFWECSRLCLQKDIYFSFMLFVYRLILALSKEWGSRADGLYGSSDKIEIDRTRNY